MSAYHCIIKIPKVLNVQLTVHADCGIRGINRVLYKYHHKNNSSGFIEFSHIHDELACSDEYPQNGVDVVTLHALSNSFYEPLGTPFFQPLKGNHVPLLFEISGIKKPEYATASKNIKYDGFTGALDDRLKPFAKELFFTPLVLHTVDRNKQYTLVNFDRYGPKVFELMKKNNIRLHGAQTNRELVAGFVSDMEASKMCRIFRNKITLDQPIPKAILYTNNATNIDIALSSSFGNERQHIHVPVSVCEQCPTVRISWYSQKPR